MTTKKCNFDCSHPYTTSIAVYEVSPSFAYAVFRIKSSGEIAENYKLWREMNNNRHFAIGEGKPRVSVCYVKACLTAHFPGTFCTNCLDLTNVLKKKDSNLASFVGKWWMYVAHARYLLIGNVLVWSITMLHVELDRQLSSSWITLQTTSCSCFHRSVDISKTIFHNFQSLLATVCSNQ